MKIAIIGAGVSGLTCARHLHDAGIDVKLFDKGHKAGGRISTRVANRETSPLSFDHGAQYFTARDERFKGVVEGWVKTGVVQEWNGNIGKVDFDKRVFEPDSRTHTRFVGVPQMRSVAEHLADGLNLSTSMRAVGISKSSGKRRIAFEDGGVEDGFDTVILSIPPQQVAALISDDLQLRSACAAIPMSPCWAVMSAFSERLPTDFDGLFVNNSKISWAARDSSKPGRIAGERWVLHGSAGWSQSQLEDESDLVDGLLLAEFSELLSVDNLQPYFHKAHRWRYAIPTNPLEAPFLMATDNSLAACGDWCGGPRVEGAFLSGLAVAERLLMLAKF